LDERYNLYAVKLMQKCYQFVFEQVLSHTHSMCNPAQESSAQEPTQATLPNRGIRFKRVIVRDATSFQLPARLAPFYQGPTGDSTGR
ncbi:hypothetical protein QNI19_19985, partial [Cytophagaceae bacterium DM2B3-1]